MIGRGIETQPTNSAQPEKPLDQMRREGKNSFIFKLQDKFPDFAEDIEEKANQLLAELNSEMAEYNEQELPYKLSEEQLKTIVDFYNLKREKSLRNFYGISSAMAVETLLSNINEYSKRKNNTNRKKVQDMFFNGITVNFSTEEKDGQEDKVRVYNSDEETLMEFDPEELNVIRAKLLSQIYKIKPDELGKSKKKIIEGLSPGASDINKIIDENKERFAQYEFLDQGENLSAFIKKSPALVEEFKKRYEQHIEYKHRYVMNKIKEASSMISELFQGRSVEDLNKDEQVLDLCCGEGDLSILLKRMGAKINGVDISDQYLKTANTFDRVSRGKGEKYIFKKDVLNDELPNGSVWVSKHPCAPNFAIPDEIINRFNEDERAHKLILLTCCANKSVNCCPHKYLEEQIISEDEWNQNCRESGQTQKKEVAQAAMRRINQARIDHIRKNTEHKVEFREIRGPVMNQMIIIEKQNKI